MSQNSALRIKELCKEKGVTLKELAAKMQVAPEALTRVIAPGSNPTLNTLLNAAKALDVDINELLVGREGKLAVSGYIELNGAVFKIRSESDLLKVTDKLKLLKLSSDNNGREER